MLVWLCRLRTIDLNGIASSLIPPAVSVGMGFLSLEFLGPYLRFSPETLRGAVLYGTLFGLIYVLVLRLTSRRMCSEVVRLLPGRAYLQRWLVLEA
jgi:hypothetical protein